MKLLRMNPIELDSLLQNGYKETILKDVKEVIFLVGFTGSGKSTFSKFLRYDKTLTIVKNAQRFYMFSDNEETIGSEKSQESKTLYPNILTDLETGTMVVDCAGFEDSRSPANDFVAAFLNKLVLDSVQRVKIVMVENFAKFIIGEDRTGLTKVLGHVANLLKNNYQAFEDAICLVATKIDKDMSDEDLMHVIRTYLNTTMEFLAEKNNEKQSEDLLRQMEILKFLLRDDKFGLFRRPTVGGDPWSSEKLKKNYEDARQLIFNKTKYTQKLDGKFHVTVSHETLNYIKEEISHASLSQIKSILSGLTNGIIENLEAELKKLPQEKVIEFCNDYSAKFPLIKSLEHVIEFAEKQGADANQLGDLKFQIDKISFLYEVTGKKLDDVVKMIVTLDGGLAKISDHVKTALDFRKFMHGLQAEFESYEVIRSRHQIIKLFSDVSAHNFKDKTVNLRRHGFSEKVAQAAANFKVNDGQMNILKSAIQTLKSDPKITNHSQEASFSHFDRSYVLSEVVKPEDTQKIVLVATQKLFIDCDWEMKNTHLVIIAPTLEVVNGKRTISMKGDDAEILPRGNSGRKGNAGFSSGSITFYVQDVINPEQLQIKSEGGNGGDGQDGSNGNNGKLASKTIGGESAGIDPSVIPLMAVPFGGAVVALGSLFGAFNKKQPTKEVMYISESPTDGTPGGDAGAGALAGDQKLFVQNTTALNRIVKVKTAGADGNPGQGGKSGSISGCTAEIIARSDGLSDQAENGAAGQLATKMTKCTYKFKIDDSFRKNQVKNFSISAIGNAPQDFLKYINSLP